MSKRYFRPGGGAVPSVRADEKMGSEHVQVAYLETVVPWRAWADMIKRSTTKKRRARDKRAVEESQYE